MSTFQNLNVLMAEDNSINRKLGALLFKKHQLSLDLAEDGRQAVEMATQKEYDIIFMDIEMPYLNGTEALKQIREKLGQKAPPTVALTAHAMEGQRETFLEQGFNEYLSKPLNYEAVKATIEKLVS